MWVSKGLTEYHIMIAKDIFDYVIERENYPQVCSLQLTHELCIDVHSLYKMTESTLNNIDIVGKDLFLNSFKEVLSKLTTELEMHAAETRSQQNDKETAIKAVFPSNYVLKHHKKILETPNEVTMTLDKLTPYIPILHLCTYLPRTRCWYSLKDIYNDGSSLALLIDKNEQAESCKFVAIHDELICIDDSSEEINVNDLNKLDNGEYKSGSIQSFLTSELDGSDMDFDFCLTTGKHDSVYLVSIFRRFESDNWERLSQIYFNVYKLQENEIAHKISQTEITAHPSDDYERFGPKNMHAKISTVSNEMLIVYSGDELNLVLVVYLNPENASPVTDLSYTIGDHDDMEIAKGTHIIETNDAMYIATDGTTHTKRYSGKVIVRYEYKINSKQLKKIYSADRNINQVGEVYNVYKGNGHGNDLIPCLSECSAVLGGGLWYIEGNNDTASFLTKVTVDDNKTPVIEHHTPPPFLSITAVFASRISSKILENKEPVTRYLGNE